MSTGIFQINNEFATSEAHLQVKNGTAIDPQSSHVRDAHVYFNPDSHNAYSVVLTRFDYEERKNLYHKLQILESDELKRQDEPRYDYWLYQTKGEIGAPGYIYDERPMTLATAIDEFEKTFFKLTRNLWKNRNNFEKYWDKMNMLNTGLFTSPDAGQIMEEPVRGLIKLLFNVPCDTCILDLKKWPLGWLSEEQIEEASEILGTLLESVIGREQDDIDVKTVIRCTNKYYSSVPRNSTSGLRLLDTMEAIEREYDFLDKLRTTEIRQCSLIESHYAALNTRLCSLDIEEFHSDILRLCMRNQLACGEIIEIFEVERPGEDERFTPFRNLANRKLLWHGSTITNFAKILSQGLCIQGVARGGTFGAGIYFSDMIPKSVAYCHATNNAAFLLVCEVALGNMHCSSSCMQLPNGFDSMKGLGNTYPDPKDDIILEDGSSFAMGPGIQSNQSSSLSYNEYVVYNEARVRMRFLVHVKFLSS